MAGAYMPHVGESSGYIDEAAAISLEPNTRRQKWRYVRSSQFLRSSCFVRPAASPGSAEGTLVVSDIVAAHDEFVGRGIGASEVWHGPPLIPTTIRG